MFNYSYSSQVNNNNDLHEYFLSPKGKNTQHMMQFICLLRGNLSYFLFYHIFCCQNSHFKTFVLLLFVIDMIFIACLSDVIVHNSGRLSVNNLRKDHKSAFLCVLLISSCHSRQLETHFLRLAKAQVKW